MVVHLLAVFHDFEQDLVNRAGGVDDDTRGSFQADEVVLVLVEEQSSPLEREREFVALAILGQSRAGQSSRR